MTCEDTPVRLTWDIQMHEPFSNVWMSKGYGRATTTAHPADIARAALTSYLALHPPRYGETLRATVRPDTSEPVTVTADQLGPGPWGTDPAVRQALPLYLRQALPATSG